MCGRGGGGEGGLVAQESAYRSYEWNPHGTDSLNTLYEFPVWALSGSSAQALWDMATENQEQKYDSKSKLTYRIRLLDSPAIDASKKSTVRVFNDGKCDPLGGYSVWSQYPPGPKVVRKPDSRVYIRTSFFPEGGEGLDFCACTGQQSSRPDFGPLGFSQHVSRYP